MCESLEVRQLGAEGGELIARVDSWVCTIGVADGG